MEREKEMKSMKAPAVQTKNAYAVLSGFNDCTLPNPSCGSSCTRQRNA